MDNGSFAYLNDRSPRTLPVIIAGIVVLVLAVIGVIIAGVIAFSRADDSPSVSSSPANAAGEFGGESTDEPTAGLPTPGTYIGTLISVAADDTTGTSWQAVATFAGDSALVVYPSTSCAVLIDHTSGDDLWNSTPLTTECSGEGSWSITAQSDRIVDIAFLDHAGVPLVEGTLSYEGDSADTSSAQ